MLIIHKDSRKTVFKVNGCSRWNMDNCEPLYSVGNVKSEQCGSIPHGLRLEITTEHINW
jgi:hypothetical protein